MQNLKIEYGKGAQKKTITVPIATISIGLRFLPKKIKTSLEKEGIDLNECRELVKEKGLTGTLIEIENSDECFVISLE